MNSNIKCRVACYNSNGEPELVEVDVDTKNLKIGDTPAIAAIRTVEAAGYTSAEWVIDEEDAGFEKVYTVAVSSDDIPKDAHLHDDPRTDSRLADAEGWGLFDVDSGGGLRIQSDDESDCFKSDDDAVEFVRLAARYSPYHAKALRLHDEAALEYDDPWMHREISNSERWGIYERKEDDRRLIQAFDNSSFFPDDDSAVEYVRRIARYSSYHAKALRIHEATGSQGEDFQPEASPPFDLTRIVADLGITQEDMAFVMRDLLWIACCWNDHNHTVNDLLKAAGRVRSHLQVGKSGDWWKDVQEVLECLTAKGYNGVS
jgi:hypothetical protein